VAGLVLVTFFGRSAPVGKNKENGDFLGYIFVIISTLLYSFYEVLYKKYAVDPKASSSASDAILTLGLMGLCNFLFLWPGVWIVHITGFETFELPPTNVLIKMVISACLDGTFNILLLLGVMLTSPLLISVGSVLVIPGSILADFIVHHYVLPPLALFGIGLIIIGFVGLNLAEFWSFPKGKNTDPISQRVGY